MGSVIFRKQRRNQSEVKEANSILLACCGTTSSSSDTDTSPMLILPGSSVSLNNISTRRFVEGLMDKELQVEVDRGKGSLYQESYSSTGEECDVNKRVFSSSCDSGSMYYPPFMGTVTNTSLMSSQSFEPTPLTQVLPQLYLGTEQDAGQAEKLIGLGITHVISIVGGRRYADLYPKHMYIPLRDNGSSNLLEKLDNSYDFMLESQEPGNKLFVHCQLGQNRSASFVIGFLMKSRKLSLHDAYTLLKEKRQLIHPHKKYIEQLRHLDLKLHKVYSTPRSFLDIVLCSMQEIKIRHLNFTKADSIKYKKSQKIHFKEAEDNLSFRPSLLS